MPGPLPPPPSPQRRQFTTPSPPTPATETLSTTYYHTLLNAIIALSVISVLAVLGIGFLALIYRRRWLQSIGLTGNGTRFPRKRVIGISFAGESKMSVAGTIDSASTRSVPYHKGPKSPAPQPPMPLQMCAQPAFPQPAVLAPQPFPGQEQQRNGRPPRRPPRRGYPPPARPQRPPPRGPQRRPPPGPQRPPPTRPTYGQPRVPKSRPGYNETASELSGGEDNHLENISEIPPASAARSNPDGPPEQEQPDDPPLQEQPEPSRHSGPPSTAHDKQPPGYPPPNAAPKPPMTQSSQASQASQGSQPPRAPTSSQPSSRRSRAPTLPSIDTHPGDWPTSQSERSPRGSQTPYPYPTAIASSGHPEEGQAWRPEEAPARDDGAAEHSAERGNRSDNGGIDARIDDEHANIRPIEYPLAPSRIGRSGAPSGKRGSGSRRGGGGGGSGSGSGSGSASSRGGTQV